MAVVARIGVDIVRVSRVADCVQQEGFLARTFLPEELADTRTEHLAGLLAAKEACFKALGQPKRWHEVQVSVGPTGRPYLCLHRAARPVGLTSLDLSISHDGDVAVAVVVALLECPADDEGAAGEMRDQVQ